MIQRTFPFRPTAIALIVVLLLLSACIASPEEAPTPTPVPRPVEAIKPTYTVQRGAVTVLFQFTGRVTPVLEQALFFRTGGAVRKLYVAEGDSATAGEMLADLQVIDDLERQRALDELAIRRAEVRLEIARLQLELAQAREDALAQEIAIKENEVTLAEIALEETRLGVRDVDTLIADAQIIAPFDGEVLSLNVAEGDMVEAFAPALVLADLDDLEVSAELRQDQLESLLVGMEAQVAPLNQPGAAIDGYIRRLPYQSVQSGPDVESQDTSVRVALASPPAEAGFELRQRVQVTVVVDQKEGVLWLPPQAIRTFEGRRFVVVQDGNVQQRVDVVLGLRSGDRVEIVEGLSEGQIVVGP